MQIPNVRPRFFVAVPAVFAAALAVAGCGGSDTSTIDGGNGTGASNNNGAGAQPNLNTGGNGNLTGNGNSGGVTTITRDAACADGTGTADAIPAVVEMVIDISGSMNERPGGMRRGMTKWQITSAALKGAVAKLPANVAVGINFFPNNPEDPACFNNQIDLGLDLLGPANSQQRKDFNDAIDGARPGDGTPTHAAFKFGAETVAASTLPGKKFVLLITDGKPTWTLTCDGDGKTAVDNQPLIDEVAKTYPAISTFVIGSPGSEDAREDLSQMASKGGTAKAGCSDMGPDYCHLDMTTATDFATALSAGLAEVAGQIGSCEFIIPPAPPGKTLVPTKVNVLYTHADGSETSIPQDQTGMCTSGWKFDNDKNPTKINLCGSDCDAVKADQSAKVDVIFGCDTQTNVPVK